MTALISSILVLAIVLAIGVGLWLSAQMHDEPSRDEDWFG